MDLLAIFTKTDQLPLKNQAQFTPPEEEFSDYVSRAIDESRDVEHYAANDRTDSESRAAENRETQEYAEKPRDDARDDESDRPAQEADGQSNQDDDLEPSQDHETADFPDSPTDKGESHDAASDGNEIQQAAGEETDAGSVSAPTQDTATQTGVDSAAAQNQDFASSTVAPAASSVNSPNAQNTAAAQNATANSAGEGAGKAAAEPIAAANAAQLSTTGQDKAQQGPAPRASEIAKKVHETLAAKAEPGNPGLQAALSELLGKGNGLRVTANTTGSGEQRPLINTAMLAATGMDTSNGNGNSAAFNLFSNTGQQAGTAGFGVQTSAGNQAIAPGSTGVIDVPAGAGDITSGASAAKALSGLTGTTSGLETVQSGHTIESAGTTALSRGSASQAASVTQQVSVQITKAVGAGNDRITIQLDPAELGRIDVKLEISGDGRVVARVTADRAETLDMLQRDNRGLEKALQQAGLQTDSDSLSFNLRQGGQGEGGNKTGSGQNESPEERLQAQENDTVESPVIVASGSGADGRLDIQV